jgi:phosphoserine phosphatase
MLKIKLIAFDLDGVLADGGGSWVSVHNALGTRKQAKANSQKYFNGEITFAEWARVDVELWRGVHIDELKRILYSVPLMKGAPETLRALKKKYVVGIISGGLSVLADKIRDDFKLDFSYGNTLLTDDAGRVVGVDNRVDFAGKGAILLEAAEKYGVKPAECAVVGDYLNDVPMFLEAGLAIAFNPQHEDVVKNADVVIKEKDLSLVLQHL